MGRALSSRSCMKVTVLQGSSLWSMAVMTLGEGDGQVRDWLGQTLLTNQSVKVRFTGSKNMFNVLFTIYYLLFTIYYLLFKV